jgi:hypothetical protein
MPKKGYRPLGPGGSGGLLHTCTVLATSRKTGSIQRTYKDAMLSTVNYLSLEKYQWHYHHLLLLGKILDLLFVGCGPVRAMHLNSEHPA